MHWRYDKTGRLMPWSDPMHWRYDKTGRLMPLSDPMHWRYDKTGRLMQLSDPMHWRYDKTGKLMPWSAQCIEKRFNLTHWYHNPTQCRMQILYTTPSTLMQQSDPTHSRFDQTFLAQLALASLVTISGPNTTGTFNSYCMFIQSTFSPVKDKILISISFIVNLQASFLHGQLAAR